MQGAAEQRKEQCAEAEVGGQRGLPAERCMYRWQIAHSASSVSPSSKPTARGVRRERRRPAAALTARQQQGAESRSLTLVAMNPLAL